LAIPTPERLIGKKIKGRIPRATIRSIKSQASQKDGFSSLGDSNHCKKNSKRLLMLKMSIYSDLPTKQS
jgi:hypothetical protein